MREKRKWRGIIFFAVFAAIFLGSSCILADQLVKQRQNTCRLEELSALAAKIQKEASDVNEELPKQTFGEEKGFAYAQVKEQNPDFVGWITIEDTKINYPVLQSLDCPNFYLDHDFDKKPSRYGAPYAAEECDLQQDCKNIVIYGHHMKDGSMFASLKKYLDREFFENHSEIQFDTLEKRGNYQVIAVFAVSAVDEEHPLMKWIWAKTPEQFAGYISYAKQQSVHETKYTAQWGDHLLSLITCEYSRRDGRLIVVAKQINDRKTEQNAK